MAEQYAPLRFPPHFPPKAKWKKFFIGVRWVGPDLSFFREFGSLQASRTELCMSLWKGDGKRKVAYALGEVFQRRLRWQKPFFIPEDQFAVIGNGSKFKSIDDGRLEDAVEEIEWKYKISMRHEFWKDMGECTFEDVVNKIVAVSKYLD